jgi:hypothetical protein
MFFPFHDKNDILDNNSSLWQSFMYQKTRLINYFITMEAMQCPHLYLYSLQILQNIQDLINIKKVPKGVEALQVCTSLSETELLYDIIGHDSEGINEERVVVENDFDEDMQLQYLTDCVNLLSENMSIFNNKNEQTQRQKSNASHPSIVSLYSTQIESLHMENYRLLTSINAGDVVQDRENNSQ